ncbi:uncharacterized protein RSE6_11442 [Rhynchosporium secalis]|uniref:AB hydrolase-1 domain-containing protein n=1 Tax=Rhynchosporium secalis TaxID=38038 RepID=A0A1E1MN04_RHYSE|nr:uncharacterized protein RSE6_11442 [Rhynchosporium secalis]
MPSLSGLIAIGAGVLASNVAASPNIITDFKSFTKGFQKPLILPSVGGHATCILGNIPVQASAMNTELKYPIPANQSVVTETIVEFLQVGSTLPAEVIGSKRNISGTYSISSKLCYPVGKSPNASAIQFLTHGVGFDKSYWDFYSSAYSYVDAAALAGHTTFSYDRLGIGASEHPDPIQVVQAALEVNIAQSLIESLKSGAIASTKFEKVIGVGHSLGSELTNAITSQYPTSLSAAVLTGFSTDVKGQPVFFAGLDLTIARETSFLRFPLLNNGYVVSNNIAGNQFAFFRLPNFDPAVLVASEATKQTFTIGELFTNSEFVSPAEEFTGAVLVVNGENDLPFCQSNCLVPENKSQNTLESLYPSRKESSGVYIAKGVGHGLNLHYGAGDAYKAIFEFLKKEGY